MARIRVTTTHGERVFPLAEEFTVGRLASNTLALSDDQAVSRDHARIERVGSLYIVSDLNSRNGTFVERGVQKWKVDDQLTLEAGDVIHVGATRLLFEISDTPPSGPMDPGVTYVPGQTVVGRVLPVPREEEETMNTLRMKHAIVSSTRGLIAPQCSALDIDPGGQPSPSHVTLRLMSLAAWREVDGRVQSTARTSELCSLDASCGLPDLRRSCACGVRCQCTAGDPGRQLARRSMGIV